jgi:hypothetical protein
VKFIAAQLRQQHVDGAFCWRLGGEFIPFNAARQIAFYVWFTDRLVLCQFQSQCRHALNGRHHARDGYAGVNDVDILPI